MNIYLVGGAVRDKLMGISSKDRDYVVVGSTPEEMIKLGFKPIGKDFPVFLHPKTNEEMIFSSILPKELNNLLKMLRNTNE